MIDREIAVPSYEEIKAARAVLTDDCIVDIQRGVAPAENIIKRMLEAAEKVRSSGPMPSPRLKSGTSRIFGPLDQLTSDSVVCLTGRASMQNWIPPILVSRSDQDQTC
jgi:hypothetical protein